MIENVGFITFVHWRDYKRLAEPGELERRIRSHNYPFAESIVIRQRLCDVSEADKIDYTLLGATEQYASEDYPTILEDFGINPDNPKADELTHGMYGAADEQQTAPHYWRWHVINHLIGLTVAKSPYIVFSDCDCRMLHQVRDRPWVGEGIQLLQKHSDILIVSPSDGGHMAERRLPGGVRLTQNVSQQLFLCDKERLSIIDFDLPWDGVMNAPGGPFQEYYVMLEGRMWRWMRAHNMWRAILSHNWRYWHDAWH